MILLCRCAGAGVLDPSLRDQALRRLEETGCAAVVVDDLCGLAAARDPALQSLALGELRTTDIQHNPERRNLLHEEG